MKYLVVGVVIIAVLFVLVIGILTVLNAVRGSNATDAENELLRKRVETYENGIEKIRRESQLQLVHADPPRLVEKIDDLDDALRALPVVPASNRGRKNRKAVGS